MTWLDRLSLELSDRGVPRRERMRILLEFEDHIACEPGCEIRLGDPSELAAGFADELATSRARVSAYRSFGALIVAAAAMTGSQVLIAPAGGTAGSGVSLALFVVATVAMVFGPQVALVSGGLGVLRAARRRRAARLPAAEIELIRRRSRVALLGGAATLTGLGLWLVDFAARLPAWYLVTVGGFAAAASLALFGAMRWLSVSARIVSGASGQAGDVYDDVPFIGRRWLRRHPWQVGTIASLTIAVLTIWSQQSAEHSTAEGLQRGIAEGIAAALGYALLGRAVGLFSNGDEGSATAIPGVPTATASRFDTLPSGQLAGDEDRAAAETLLRASFVAGRVDVDDLTTRISAVHQARTVAQLCDAISDLPDPR